MAQPSFGISKIIFPKFGNDQHFLHPTLQTHDSLFCFIPLLQKIGKVLLNFGDKWQILQLHIQTAFQCVSSVSPYSSIYGTIVELSELAARDQIN